MNPSKSDNNGNQINKKDDSMNEQSTSTSGGKGNQLTNLDAVKEVVDAIENNHKSLVEEYKVMSEEYKLLLEFLDTLENRLFKHVYSDTPLDKRIENFLSNYNALLTERDELGVERDELRVKRDKLRVERDKLRVERDSLNAYVPLLFESNNNLRKDKDNLMKLLVQIEEVRLLKVDPAQSLEDRVNAILNDLPLI